MIGVRAQQKEKTRRLLIDAALKQLSAERSFSSLSLREVAKEAGTNYYTSTHSLDVIGVIHVESGTMLTGEGLDGEAYEYPEMAPIDGWHANLLLHGEELPASLEPFVIEAPSNPHRKFA